MPMVPPLSIYIRIILIILADVTYEGFMGSTIFQFVVILCYGSVVVVFVIAVLLSTQWFLGNIRLKI
jgi:hypothetical protein